MYNKALHVIAEWALGSYEHSKFSEIIYIQISNLLSLERRVMSIRV